MMDLGEDGGAGGHFDTPSSEPQHLLRLHGAASAGGRRPRRPFPRFPDARRERPWNGRAAATGLSRHAPRSARPPRCGAGRRPRLPRRPLERGRGGRIAAPSAAPPPPVPAVRAGGGLGQGRPGGRAAAAPGRRRRRPRRPRSRHRGLVPDLPDRHQQRRGGHAHRKSAPGHGRRQQADLRDPAPRTAGLRGGRPGGRARRLPGGSRGRAERDHRPLPSGPRRTGDGRRRRRSPVVGAFARRGARGPRGRLPRNQRPSRKRAGSPCASIPRSR